MTALPDGVREALERGRGEIVAGVTRRAGGANSEVWEVATAGGARYLVKRYPPGGPGEPDRLATEFAALAFLSRHGVDRVPAAVCALPERRVGVFGFVDGLPLEPREVGAGEVRQAAAFLARLHGLRAAAGAAELPVAKEACFSIAAHQSLVRARVQRLREGTTDPDLHDFLKGELAPHLERVSAWIAACAGEGGVDPGAELPGSARTLSPSDFGFHNALRRPGGTLVFIDFEYFGWDDPAKTVADFLLQPAVPVPEPLRDQACRRLLEVYGSDPDLGRRLPPVYALLSVKWCLIVLNVFLRPEGEVGATAVRAVRLARARDLLGRARREFETRAFPFGESPEGASPR